MKYQLPIYDISIEEAEHLGVRAVAMVSDPAIQELWVAMANEEIKLAADNDKMIVTGAALVPNRLIYRLHPKTGAEYYIRFSAEVIQQIVQRYFTQNRQIAFNLEHNTENAVQGVILESWIVKDPTYDQSVLYGFKNIIPGTWMISVKVEDETFWKEYVKAGKVKGFSIEGAFAQELAEQMSKQELVIDRKAGETQDEFVSRCIAFEVGNGYDVDQATAMCYAKWDEGVKLDLKEFELTAEEAEILIKEILLQESYTDYPQAASDAAKRALKYKEENPGNSCGTRVGWARANQLADRRPISEETIARMASFARHLQWEDVSYEDGCGGLMVDAWGGRSGIEWAKRKLEQIRRRQNN